MSIQHNEAVEKEHRVETKEQRGRCVGEFQGMAAKARVPCGLSGHGAWSGPEGSTHSQRVGGRCWALGRPGESCRQGSQGPS